MEQLLGSYFNDPRVIRGALAEAGLTAWLDVERLESGNKGLFESIAQGLKHTRVVLAFVSDDYALSANCRMEYQFALKSLQKPMVTVVVGSGSKWRETVVGLLAAGQVC